MKTILFSTDLSKHANNALKYAIQLSKQTSSQLVVFHSSYIPEMVQKEEYDKIVSGATLFKQEALEDLVTKLCEEDAIDLPPNIVYEVKNEESIAGCIIEAAKKHHAELIVVGTHGITALKKVVFGSITAKLLLKSKVPVLAIPQGFTFEKIRKIVYASDMKHLKNELELLTPIATSLGAMIDVLYLDYWEKGKEKEDEFNETVKDNKNTTIHFIKKEVTIDKTLVEHIIDYTNKQSNAMVSMFPADRGFFDKLFFQSNTENMAFHINRPILSIRK